MKAILSIKPSFVDKILSGEKQFEYRKKIFKQGVSTVIIYSSAPVQKFVGEFTIRNIIHSDIEDIWIKTNLKSGISYDYYKKYFSNHSEGYALEIVNLKIYNEPITPTEIIPDFKPPQSYCYIRNSK